MPMLPTTWSVADLHAHVSGIPLSRIRLYPYPGTATEDDAFRLHASEGVLCELVDGVLVEKPMGAYESAIAVELAFLLKLYLQKNPCGFLLGAGGPIRPRRSRMRLPDISFFAWDRFPNRAIPRVKVIPFSPDLAVEILSEGNTVDEIDTKLDEYFTGGTRLAWIIDTEQRTATIYTSRNAPAPIAEHGSLRGEPVLPGFSLVLADLLNAVPRDIE
jgi:Uma2 family endonuclease